MNKVIIELVNEKEPYSKLELPNIKITDNKTGKPVVIIDFQGEEGNIYEIIPKVYAALRDNKMDKQGRELDKYINSGKANYPGIIKKMTEYVTLINISGIRDNEYYN